MRESHEAGSTSLEAGEAGADAERLAVTEEVAELAAAKDELYALSNKAQLGMQRADHHDAEATELAARVDAGRSGDHRAARAGGGPGGEHRGDRGPAGRDRRAPRTASEREYEAQARLQEARRAMLAEARARAGGGAGGDRGRPGEHRPARGRAGGGAQRRDDLTARVASVAAEETAAGERLEVLVGEERRMRDEIDGLAARVDDGAGAGGRG